jgi:hypothetical protein
MCEPVQCIDIAAPAAGDEAQHAAPCPHRLAGEHHRVRHAQRPRPDGGRHATCIILLDQKDVIVAGQPLHFLVERQIDTTPRLKADAGAGSDVVADQVVRIQDAQHAGRQCIGQKIQPQARKYAGMGSDRADQIGQLRRCGRRFRIGTGMQLGGHAQCGEPLAVGVADRREAEQVQVEQLAEHPRQRKIARALAAAQTPERIMGDEQHHAARGHRPLPGA